MHIPFLRWKRGVPSIPSAPAEVPADDILDAFEGVRSCVGIKIVKGRVVGDLRSLGVDGVVAALMKDELAGLLAVLWVFKTLYAGILEDCKWLCWFSGGLTLVRQKQINGKYPQAKTIPVLLSTCNGCSQR